MHRDINSGVTNGTPDACRMDTDAESVALYGRVLGYGTCGRDGHTVKAPAADTCGRWWSPLAPATEEVSADAEH